MEFLSGTRELEPVLDALNEADVAWIVDEGVVLLDWDEHDIVCPDSCSLLLQLATIVLYWWSVWQCMVYSNHYEFTTCIT